MLIKQNAAEAQGSGLMKLQDSGPGLINLQESKLRAAREIKRQDTGLFKQNVSELLDQKELVQQGKRRQQQLQELVKQKEQDLEKKRQLEQQDELILREDEEFSSSAEGKIMI